MKSHQNIVLFLGCFCFFSRRTVILGFYLGSDDLFHEYPEEVIDSADVLEAHFVFIGVPCPVLNQVELDAGVEDKGDGQREGQEDVEGVAGCFTAVAVDIVVDGTPEQIHYY